MLKEIKYIMIHFLRNLQLLFASAILIATSIGFVLEVVQMINLRTVSLPDLLLLFIYLEVIGMVTSYWRTQTIRLTYPLFIAITALSRLIILQQKDSIDPSALIYESGAVLLLAIAIVILKFRRSKHLGIKLDKEEL
jgi:protein PsiE